ncbi:MAG: hypothetical protein IPG50_17965 [Myxococcales bacterium]|nr:hypothetical protein [Myxococcales bacterium]
MSTRLRAAARVLSVAAPLLVAAPGARAAEAVDAAAEARTCYERGLRAHAAREFALAAREFARADAWVPSNAAIEAALEAARQAGDPVLAMELVDRAHGRQLDGAARAAAARAEAAFASSVARYLIPCDKALACHAFVDGVEVPRPREAVLVTPGNHRVRVVVGERSREVELEAKAQSVVAVPAPEGDDRPVGPPRVELRPEQGPGFWSDPNHVVATVTFGAAMAAGAFALVSYLDLRDTRARFERGACGAGAASNALPAGDCPRLADDGKTAQLMTQVSLAATGVFVATGLTFLVWSPLPVRARLAARGHGGLVMLEGTLP